MSILSYNQKQIDRSSSTFGRMFELSAKKRYSSKKFIKQVMTYSDYKDLILFDEGQEWCDECFLLRCFENIKPFEKGGIILDDYELWFMGYLYNYWIKTRKVEPKEVYKILPFKTFDSMFGFYHTQGWEYIINDATKQFNNR